MTVLLLYFWLCASLCEGFLADKHDSVRYGSRYNIYVTGGVHSIEFSREDSSGSMVIWEKGKPQLVDGFGKIFMDYSYVIDGVTPKHSGRYVLKDKDGLFVRTIFLMVTEYTHNISRKADQKLTFSGHLSPSSCNVFFIPAEGRATKIVSQGQLVKLEKPLCPGLTFEESCRVTTEESSSSCTGTFEFVDNDGFIETVVYVEVEPSPVKVGYIVGGVAAGLSLLCACCKCCCCGSSSSKEEDPESPSKPEESDQQGDADHATEARFNQPEEDQSRALLQPPAAPQIYPVLQPPADPQVYPISSLADDSLPPPYPVDSTPAKPEDTGGLSSHSNIQSQFEIKDVTFGSDSPLGSNSQHCDTYNSDKLNFL